MGNSTYHEDYCRDDSSAKYRFDNRSDYRCAFEVDFCKFTQPWYNDFDWQRRSGPTPTSGTGPQVDHTYGNVYLLRTINDSQTASLGSLLWRPTVHTARRGSPLDKRDAKLELPAHRSHQRRRLSYPVDSLFRLRNHAPVSLSHSTLDTIRQLGIDRQSQRQKRNQRAAIYHPPNAPTADSLIDHLLESMDLISSKHPNAGFILLGDFIELDITPLTASNGFAQVVDKPTRGHQTLGKIVSNINQFYVTPSILPPLGASDHATAMWSPREFTPKPNRVHIRTTRPMPDSAMREFGQKLSDCDWSHVHDATDVDAKCETFYSTLLSLIDTYFPTRTGFYIYTEANGRVRKYSSLESASIPAATMGTVCVYFWYHMYGSDMGTLNVRSQVDGDLLQVFWTRSNSLDDNWYQGQAEYTSTEDFQIVFQGVIGDNYRSDMALDDISIVAEPCRALHQCDFEQENLCGYTQDQSDDFDWTWNSGYTTSDYTGPSFDVTMGTTSGHYVYIEASDHNAGDVARLTTPELDPSGSNEVTCWSFYYHMFGDDIGDLNVYIDKELDQSLWSLGGRNLGDRWFYAEVNVSRYENYSLTFEGVVGDGPQGDLAIDEVDYRLGYCQGAGSCDFENGLCSWMNIGGDEFDWSRHRGSTSTGTTGPNVDHTTGTSSGHYMYTEETGKAIGERAILYLDEPLSSGQQCLRFWYHMLGVGHGELIVFASNTSSLMMDDHYVWSLAGPQNPDQDTWLLGQVPMNFDLTYAVYFVGIIGSGSSDTALDDISFQSGHCDVVPSEAAPGSDVLPLSCDFDADRCFWRESLDDDFNWIRQTGPTISAGTGPDTDHSGT
ncbi:MAM and LDL-receptor class A domain-containing protein 1-like, partial [Diadema antillarum]|uniref:MAM and LDL-receptor class A domain-containing protein 1-like n=1 Tax=Diadema antillarum TaxID=105358 RepID=UPI003A875341